jgi:hypothetical protein
MKHRLVHPLQKYVLNPPIRLLFALGIAPPGYGLLETIGARQESLGVLPPATDELAINFGSWPSAERKPDMFAILRGIRVCG